MRTRGVCVNCHGQEVPFAHAFVVGVLLWRRSQATASVCRMAWEAFIDSKA
ncbi:hypothetical protein [Streptomyces sp. SD15]